MTQLLLINDKSYTDNDDREIGDVVGIFDDSHTFSEKEKIIFDIVSVPETKVVIQAMMKKVNAAFKSTTTDWTFDEPEIKQLWENSDGDWMELEEKPRFELNYNAKNKKYTNNIESKVANNTKVAITKAVEAIG